jgi:hypothetical protein
MRPAGVDPPAGILVGVTAFVTAGGGFLLAILYADLLHDVQVLGHRGSELPLTVLESISRFYRRVTIAARPLNRLVVVVMAEVLVSIVVQIARGDHPRWVGWASLAFAGAPIALAGLRTFPAAVRLGGRTDSPEAQSRLARSIFRDHLLCVAGIGSLLAVQLGFAG